MAPIQQKTVVGSVDIIFFRQRFLVYGPYKKLPNYSKTIFERKL
jgi:hypothetical protein